MNIVSDILNFLFPRTCVMCGRRLNVHERSLCAPCTMHLPRTDTNAGSVDSKLEKTFWTQFPIERAASLFFYKGDNVRHILHSLKYYEQPNVGYDLARIAAEELLPSGFFDGIDCIIPVPIHWQRRLKRGYNQSEYIARGLQAVTNIPIYNNVVRRVVNNTSQTHLSHADRRENTTGIFALRRADKILGKHILLVDDVITTGSTIGSCAKVLSQAGNTRISIFSLAHATSSAAPTTAPHSPDILSTGLPLLD